MKKQVLAFAMSLALCLTLALPALAQQGTGTTSTATIDSLQLDNLDIQTGSAGPADLIVSVINALFGLLGTIALIAFIYAGFKWMMSGTDTKGVEASKALMRNTAVGIFIILAAYSLSTFVFNALTEVTGN